MNIEIENRDMELLISQFVSGQIGPASLKVLKEWMAESEENKLFVKNQIEICMLAGASRSQTRFDSQEAYSRFLKRIRADKSRLPLVAFSWKVLYRVAVVVLVLLLPLSYWVGRKQLKGSFQDIVIEAPLGAQTKMLLPDGTKVWLNAGSKLTYSQGFGVENRQMELVGEGYFEVAENEKLPLKVKTHELNLQVLGTKFNFCNYNEDREAMVDLLEGKVELQLPDCESKHYQLNPNQRLVLDKQTRHVTLCNVNAADAKLWTTADLFFDEALLEDIALKLSRCYNVTIEVADSLRNKRFYGNFKLKSNSIDEILSMMAATQRLKYRYENNKYIFY